MPDIKTLGIGTSDECDGSASVLEYSMALGGNAPTVKFNPSAIVKMYCNYYTIIEE